MDLFWKLLFDFGPIALVLGVFLFAMRRGPFLLQRQHFERSRQYMSDHSAEIKRLNTSLERIANALEARNSDPQRPGG